VAAVAAMDTVSVVITVFAMATATVAPVAIVASCCV
jgi:hypothetical protein